MAVVCFLAFVLGPAAGLAQHAEPIPLSGPASLTRIETVTYVANINKYYMAYTDFYESNLQRQLEIKSVESAPKN